jgi:hypothetical protein
MRCAGYATKNLVPRVREVTASLRLSSTTELCIVTTSNAVLTQDSLVYVQGSAAIIRLAPLLPACR